ncbi:hypothetical protein FD25_GL002420 [Levilactobacillus acidifarinae DSM 19394]|uniref:Integral membrane protein n=2 Tax=Levilactobacillus acidifarinae TaxID=267364 RepID=A0A0R1LWA5_9LACO|nr:hypothetical protein FD25_GL002420 [Levilactobacillus acidifarinae DSM 19394]
MIAALMTITFGGLFQRLSLILGLDLVLVIGIFIMFWMLQRRLDVKSYKGMYWVSDERERDIALKVHSAIMTGNTYFLYGLLLVIFLLMHFGLSTQRFGQILLVIVWLYLIAINVQYFWLWNHYDQD